MMMMVLLVMPFFWEHFQYHWIIGVERPSILLLSVVVAEVKSAKGPA